MNREERKLKQEWQDSKLAGIPKLPKKKGSKYMPHQGKKEIARRLKRVQHV